MSDKLCCYRIDAACTQLDLVHRTQVDEVPTAICGFQGRLLVGVGRLLRLYDMGKKKLLRKCENKVSSLCPLLFLINSFIYTLFNFFLTIPEFQLSKFKPMCSRISIRVLYRDMVNQVVSEIGCYWFKSRLRVNSQLTVNNPDDVLNKHMSDMFTVID